jgi:hypothetical protein
MAGLVGAQPLGLDRVGPFPVRPLVALLDEAGRGRSPRVSVQARGSAMRIAWRPLSVGRHMLAGMTSQARGREPGGFDSVSPWVLRVREAVLHGPLGVLRIGDDVVADTLAGDGVLPDGESAWLRCDGRRHELGGATLSLLGVRPESYEHWMIDGLGRLAALSAVEIAGFDHVLVPAGAHALASESLARAGIAAGRVVVVGSGDVMRAALLSVPWSVSGGERPHPLLREFFLRLAGGGDAGGARRVYLAQEGAAAKLTNEAELIEALIGRGFAAVWPERLSLEARMRLMGEAQCVVAAQGAGLSDLLFASAGARVLELQADRALGWRMRALAAISGLDYDCVIGRAAGDGSWRVSVIHVLAALQAG